MKEELIVLRRGIPLLLTIILMFSPLIAGPNHVKAAGSDVTLWGTTVTGSMGINVVNPVLESITATLVRPNLFVGDQTNIQVEGVMSDGSQAELETANIAYMSSDESVATVVDGLITVHQPGDVKFTVTVTLGDKTKTAEVSLTVDELTNSKTRQTYYTPEKIAAARENTELYNWAKSQHDGVIANADHYLELGYDFLWESVPGQTIPRSYAVNEELGSPVSGKAIGKYGNYPYKADPVNMPWKLIDPSATDENGDPYIYPTNDFESYYKSGLDERGIFQPELADPVYLVNELYPEKGPDWGVDDGYGWVDDDGNRYTFIAYYTHWHLWQGIIGEALSAFEDAYVLTGDPKYAYAGIILLDRIADVYPDMDISVYPVSEGFLNSDGGTGLGKIIGSIWETGLSQKFISAYDAFFPAIDNEVVIDFLSEKADIYDLGVLKRSATGIRRNIEDNILREIYPAVKQGQIRGNNGMHQSTLALAAVVLDHLPETKEWLDFNFQAGAFLNNPYRLTGGNILASLVNYVDRDGSGNEASPSYNQKWLEQYLTVADILNGYDLYPEADLYQNVKFRKMFMAQFPLTMLERYTPTIGDTGYAGNPILTLNKSQILKAFQVYGDPIFAQVAYAMNNNHSAGLYADIFTKNPEALAEQVQAVIDEYGPLNLEGTNLTGYGFSALRDGIRTGSELGISYLFPTLSIVDQSVGSTVFPASSTVQLEAKQPGHHITFAFDLEIPGEYEVYLRPFRAISYGKYNVYLDDRLIKEIDFFGSVKELEYLTTMELDVGRHLIKFENTGKAEESINYKMGVTELFLAEVEADSEIEEPVDTMRDLWMYYGRNSGHGHRDTLNLGIHAFGLDLAPDLGYPRFADSTDINNRFQWVNNTISHNTVVVNKGKQQLQEVAFPKHFDGDGRVQLTDVEAPKVYPDTSQYRRTSALIKVDEEDSYIVDFFRVNGGQDHHFSFHSMEGEVVADGMEMVPQTDGNGDYVGTYAGRDVAFGQRADDVDGAGYMGSGFQWLKDVDRASRPDEQISLDWNVKDTWNMYGNGAGADTDIHLRLTMLTQLDEAALATGVPPDNKPGNPEEIRYFIGHRTADNGEEADSLFTSVIEPYQGNRFVQSIEQVSIKKDDVLVDSNDVQAVKVILENGRTDYIVYSLDTDAEYILDDQLRFSGFFGVYSLKDGEEVYRYVQDGTVLAPMDKEFKPVVAGLEGEVLDFTREMEIENEIRVRLDTVPESGFQAGDLVGKWIFIEDDGIRNAVYEIKSIEALSGDNEYLLDIGDITLIRSFVNVNDFGQGFVYDVKEGANIYIPLAHEYETVPLEEMVEEAKEMIQSYESSGDATGPMVQPLLDSLDQVMYYWNMGSMKQARHHMERFVDHLNNPSLESFMAEHARDALNMLADRLMNDHL